MKEIKVSNERPQLVDRLEIKFGVKFEDGIIVPIENTIHCAYEIQPQKYVHELVHLNRQKEIGTTLWWDMYIDNDVFRLEEEILAYREEYKFLKRNIKNREHLYGMLREMATHMSSKMYGSLVSFSEAIVLIKG